MLYNIVVLPFEAYKNADAIFLANWRLLFTKKRLLQWTPYAAQKSGGKKTIADAYRYMWQAVLLVIIMAALIIVFVLRLFL